MKQLARYSSSSSLSPAKNDPLLYWVTLAYVVGVPNFVHFDSTGRSSNPINLTTISTIVLTIISGYLLVVCLILRRPHGRWDKINLHGWLWVLLVLQLLFSSLVEPSFRVSSQSRMDLLLSLFYLAQWVIAFVLVLALYRGAAAGRATELTIELIGRASWAWVAIVWIVLPIMPAQAYGKSEETHGIIRTLGGQLIHPGKLASLAAIAFFYAVFYFPKGPYRWAACTFALVTIALTKARTAEAAFILALLVYALFLSRNVLIRWGTIVASCLGSVLVWAFSQVLLRYISRGQSLETLSSLDDRTLIWRASWAAIKLRPLLGYGFVVGERRALRDHWKYLTWIPPHSHNEFIGSLMAGGVVVLAVILCIYGVMLWEVVRNALTGKHPFLSLVYLQLVVITVSGPILSNRFGAIGGVFILCCMGVLGRRRNGASSQFLEMQHAGAAKLTVAGIGVSE